MIAVNIKTNRDIGKVLSQIAPREARNLTRSTVHALAIEGRKDLARVAPDDPRTKKGDLKRSFKAKRQRPKNDYFSSTVSGKFYWRFLEFGTVKMSPRKFARQSRDRMEAKAPDLYRALFIRKLQQRLSRIRGSVR